MIFELCYAMKWTDEYVLDLPVQRFWAYVDLLSARRARENRANAADPLGATHQHAQARAAGF